MLEKSLVSPVKLKQTLKYQTDNGGLIGEIMVNKNIITAESLSYLLVEQYWRKNFGSSFIKN